MTISSFSIASRVRRLFGDDDSAQIVSTDLVHWINDATRDIAIAHDLLQTKGTAATVANQAAYSLPTMLRLRRVSYQGIFLQNISIEQADELVPTHDQSNSQGYPSGTPSHYWIYAGQIQLYPAPATSSAADLNIYYTAQPTVITALSADDTVQDLNIPVDYMSSIVDYCMRQAYELDANIQMYNLKTSEYQQGLDKLRGNQDWENQSTYPYITSIPEYDGGLG